MRVCGKTSFVVVVTAECLLFQLRLRSLEVHNCTCPVLFPGIFVAYGAGSIIVTYLSRFAGPTSFSTWSTYLMTSPRYLCTVSRNWIESSNFVCRHSGNSYVFVWEIPRWAKIINFSNSRSFHNS